MRAIQPPRPIALEWREDVLVAVVSGVAGTIGSTLVPEMALDQLVGGSSELRAIRLDEPSPHRRLAFITRLNFAGVPSIQVLMALFAEELRKRV